MCKGHSSGSTVIFAHFLHQWILKGKGLRRLLAFVPACLAEPGFNR